jgi:hypothetical protein
MSNGNCAMTWRLETSTRVAPKQPVDDTYCIRDCTIRMKHWLVVSRLDDYVHALDVIVISTHISTKEDGEQWMRKRTITSQIAEKFELSRNNDLLGDGQSYDRCDQK